MAFLTGFFGSVLSETSHTSSNFPLTLPYFVLLANCCRL